MTAAEAPMSVDRPASRRDVIACYHTFLGRPPESEAVVDHALADRPGLWAVIRRFSTCPEALRRQEQEAARRYSQEQDGRGIEFTASPAKMAQLTGHIEQVWSHYGRTDAYYSVLTHPAYLMERITGAGIDSFYATGAETVGQFERVRQRNDVAPDPSASILELGCGVGRLGEAFRRLYQTYIGVDISAEHLQIARERFRFRNLDHVQLYDLRKFLQGDTTYDIFYSFLVLQHNPPPIIYNLLDTCLGRLNAGGYAYFQAPCFLYDYSFSIDDYLAGRGRKDEMEMHALPQHLIFGLLRKHGLVPIEVTPDPHIGTIGFSYTFFAHKAEVRSPHEPTD
jgi:SAM-dependent methyltransferase